MSVKTRINNNEVIYERTPSMGGIHRYFVFMAVTIVAVNLSLPLACFGIVFGQFLSSLGDETSGTSYANGVFNTVVCFTGLAANILLNKWSCRNVGLLGALVCSIGCFSLLYVQNLISFIVFFGVFQGFGYGLLLPASLTALNNFFDDNLSLIQSSSQALMVAFTMLVPPMATAAMNIFEYRGTLLWIGGISLLNIPSAVVLSRMSWIYKKIPTDVKSNMYNQAYADTKQISIKCKSTDDLRKDWEFLDKPLLKKHNSLKDIAGPVPKEFRILHLADKTASTVCVRKAFIGGESGEEGKSDWKPSSTSVDFSLLKNLKYVNIAIGLSLSYSSDVCFISIIPLVLSDIGFSYSDIAITMTIFFGCDLVSRILLSVVSAVRTPKSRYLVLWGSLLSTLFRFAFLWHHTFLWKTVTLGALGFLRCFIQTPLPLVISEEYHNQFASAYSLYMVVCGVVTLVLGPLMSFVHSLTNSNVMVCHLLTSCYVICVVSWMGEIVIDLRKKKQNINQKPAFVA